MRLLTLTIPALLAFCTGCTSSRARAVPLQERTISRTTTTGIVEGRTNWSNPISIPGQPTVLIPFAIESRKGLFAKDDPYSRGGHYEASMDYAAASKVGRQAGFMSGSTQVRWHNAVMRDMKSGQEWTILNQRGVIGEWFMSWMPPKKDEPIVCRAMVFIAVVEDTNKDGELDDLDARVAILTNADGSNPREITPRDAQVWNVTFDPERDSIYMLIARDTDGDGKITSDDSPIPYFAKPGMASQAEPVSPATQSKVRGLLK